MLGTCFVLSGVLGALKASDAKVKGTPMDASQHLVTGSMTDAAITDTMVGVRDLRLVNGFSRLRPGVHQFLLLALKSHAIRNLKK